MNSKRYKFKLFIDKALSDSPWQQVGILVVIFILTLLLSFLLLSGSGADWRHFCEAQDIKPWLLPIYLLIDSNALNTLYTNHAHGWMLFACIVTYLFGLLVFNGMIIGVITNLIDRRVEAHRDGMLHYVKSGHYVIMGYDDMVPSIILDLFQKRADGETDVVLLTSLDAKEVRETLECSVARDKMDRIFITYGHCTMKDDYADIHLESAKEIFIVGDRSHPAHDAVNVECADNIRTYLADNQFQQAPKRITCVFEDLDTYAAFKTTEIFSGFSDLDIEFVPYNFYVCWARQVFIKRSYHEKNAPMNEFKYPAIYGNGIRPEDDKRAHLVFIGVSNLAVAFAMEAAHLLHFPNFERDPSTRTRITFIDLKADEELKLFATRNRHFFEIQPYLYRDSALVEDVDAVKTDLLSKYLDSIGFLDVEFEFIKEDAFSSDSQHLLRSWAVDERQHLSIFLAMADQRRNFALGMNLPDEVYDQAIPIFIRQDQADNFVTNLRNADSESIHYYFADGDKLGKKERNGRYAHIYPIGMNDVAYINDEQALTSAKLINYLYRNHFPDTATLDGIPDESLWREAEKAWKGLTVAEKWSSLYSAYSIACKSDCLRAMRGLSLDDTSQDRKTLSADEEESLAGMEHNRWNVEKLLMGYRKAKPNEDRYLHPEYAAAFSSCNKKKLYIHYDIRPFRDLDDIRQYDFDIIRAIPWITQKSVKYATF